MTNAQLLPNGMQQFLDADGQPLASGFVAFYEPSTLTPKTTWANAGRTIENANPVQLDAAGRAVIYGLGTYRQIVTTAHDVEVWDRLTQSVPVGGFLLWAGESTGTANAPTLTLENDGELQIVDDEPVGGQAIAFIAGATNSGAVDLTIEWASETFGPANLLKRGPEGPVELTGGELVADNLYIIVWDDQASGWFLQAQNQVVAIPVSVFQPVNDQIAVIVVPDGETWVLPANASGSRGYAEVASASQVDISLMKNASTIGTVRFPAATNACAFVAVAETSFTGGDRIKLVFPSAVEATTLESLGITLLMARTG